MARFAVEVLLDEVEQAARRADLEALARLAPALEAGLVKDPPGDPALIRRLGVQARRVAGCLAAAARGVQAARQRLAEMRRAAGPLRTYDRQGQATDHAAPTAPSRRF
jgi:hypothetical protein